MKKITLALIFLFLPSVAFAGSWIKGVGDTLGRGLITDATGIDVNKQQGGGQETPNNQQGTYSGGLQRGAATIACGCNGNIQIGARRQNQECASGVDQTVLCRGGCSGGGSPWAAICQ